MSALLFIFPTNSTLTDKLVSTGKLDTEYIASASVARAESTDADQEEWECLLALSHWTIGSMINSLLMAYVSSP